MKLTLTLNVIIRSNLLNKRIAIDGLSRETTFADVAPGDDDVRAGWVCHASALALTPPCADDVRAGGVGDLFKVERISRSIALMSLC